MKIYASRKTPELKDFIGKPVWVKVHRKNGSDFYIKVLSIEDDMHWESGDYNRPTVHYHAISATYFDTHPSLLEPDDEYVTRIWTSYLDNMQLASPVELLADDEILNFTNKNEIDPNDIYEI